MAGCLTWGFEVLWEPWTGGGLRHLCFPQSFVITHPQSSVLLIVGESSF